MSSLFFPFPALSTFPSLPPPAHPPLCPPNSLFLFDLPSLQGWLQPKRGEQRGTCLCLCHSHFQCHKFQFPILLSFFFSPPPRPPHLLLLPSCRTHAGNSSILFLSVFRSHLLVLSLLSKHLLAIIPSHVFPRPVQRRMQFSPSCIGDEIQMKDR